MKKIVSICALAAMAFGLSSFAPIVSPKTGMEINAAGDCPLDGKWQIVSAEMSGQTIDMSAENGVWEFVDGTVKATSKSLPASTDKYTRNGNTLTIVDSKSGEKQAMTIVKCSADELVIKVDVEGMIMHQNMKKIK